MKILSTLSMAAAIAAATVLVFGRGISTAVIVGAWAVGTASLAYVIAERYRPPEQLSWLPEDPFDRADAQVAIGGAVALFLGLLLFALRP